MSDGLIVALCIAAAIVLIPIALFIAFLTWPFWVCLHFGHPVIGVLLTILWIAAINR